METHLTQRFSALSHPQRLALFALLVRRYPDRLPAGDIGALLGARPSTLSAWLTELTEAGLIEHERRGTSLLYRARMEGAQALVQGLLGETVRNRFLPEAGRGEGRVMNVLFIGAVNGARSLMAEALLREAAGNRFEAFSAGVEPASVASPQAIAMLAELSHDTGLLWAKPLSGFLGDDAARMDLVITLCDRAANAALPTLPGTPVQGHWGLPDPVAAGTAEAFASTYLTLRSRIERLTALPATAPRGAWQAAVDALATLAVED